MKPYELFIYLYKKNLIQKELYPFWWPNYGKFEVVLESILTQQSKWEKVCQSITFLREFELLSLENIASCEQYKLASAIVPSGLYNQKASRIVSLCQNILKDFKDLENFRFNVSREWLLTQKGIGFESADAICCYFCKRDVLVVDSYTNKLFRSLGYEIENYNELKDYIENDLSSNMKSILQQCDNNLSIHQIFALFHGLIVEFSKQKVSLNV